MTWDPESTGQLLARLKKRGVRFYVKVGVLEIDAPAGVLDEVDRTQLAERRWDLAAWLGGDRTETIRRLSVGRVAWLPKRPPAKDRRPRTAILEYDGDDPDYTISSWFKL